MKEFTAYVLDTERYVAQPLFSMEAESPEIVLILARERLIAKGLPVAPPYCIEVLPIGMMPMNMLRRQERVNSHKSNVSERTKKYFGISYGINQELFGCQN